MDSTTATAAADRLDLAETLENRLRNTLDSIARTHFHQLRQRHEPLVGRNSDAHDFIDTAVWAIRAALEEAYQCGWADAEQHHGLQD